MKRINSNIFFLIVIFIFLLNIIVSCKKTNSIRPVKGRINLTNWDFNKDRIVKLNGEWEFYWEQLLTHEDFKSDKPKLSSYFKIPDTWYKYKLNNTKLDSYGYATYRLIINLNDIEDELALKIPKMSTAYNLFINGKKIASNGIVGRTKKEIKPQYLPLVADFKTESAIIEIIIQISNFNERLGGLKESIFFGEKQQISKTREFNLSFDFLFFGCVLLMSIYHINLFIFRKKDFVSLYFGLFCLVIAFRIIVSSELFLCQLFPEISWEFIRKSYALTFFLSVPLFSIFMKSLYESQFSKNVLLIIKITSFFFLIITFITPAIIYTNGIKYFNYLTFIFCLYIFYVLYKALLKKKEGSILFMTAFFVFFITIVNDILYTETYIQSIMLVPYGFLFFIFFQVFILSRRFSLSFTKIEIMSDELQKVNKEMNELNINLEKKVQERTMELEYAKNEVEKTSREKSQFFINLAHETKTPLTLILNYFKYYKTHYGCKKGRYELEIIEKNLYKLKRDMINFLNHEKLISGEKFYNHNQIIFLNDYLEKNISLYRVTANNKKILVDYEKPKHKCHIKIDPSAMDEILHNMMINAVNYTNKYGFIKIRLSGINDRITLVISDNGIGMTEDQLRNIFIPFHQLSNEKENSQGMGMGLSIVKGLLDKIDGRIEVTSRINEGTTFFIYFKKYILNKNDIVIDDYTSIYQEENFSCFNNEITLLNDNFVVNRRNILIIEDNYEMLSYLHRELNKQYNTYCASNGLDAISRLKNIPRPDVIITDVMMDHMDGYAFLKKLKKSNYYDIPVIFLTARTSESDKIKGLEEGAFDYIYKPFIIEELKMKLDNIIRYKLLNKKSIKKKFINKLSRLIDEPNQYQYENIKKNKGNNIDDLSYIKNILTKKEMEIINEVLKGKMNKEISSDLSISLGTVKAHMNSIYKKLFIQNRVGLINKINDILKKRKGISII